MSGRGILLAAPSSGAGKTTLTLGILRALTDEGLAIRAAKSGPDFIDPAFHGAAIRGVCGNLDAWAMSPETIKERAAGEGILVIEGAMGLFDGAPPHGKGASADLARELKIPVVLIIDAAKMAHSVAPLVAGFARHDPQVNIAAIILNNVGSPRHEALLRSALASLDIPVLGAIPRSEALARPSRHLGLVQAGEHPDLEEFLATAAEIIRAHIDLAVFTELAAPLPPAPAKLTTMPALTPNAKTIAIAQDAAFAFTYPHLLDAWRAAGATLSFFSPLKDEPAPVSEFIYLPGGYPELHAATLARANRFQRSIRDAAKAGCQIYGECGGYMTLGETLIDAEGKAHDMLGLLPLVTSFQSRKLHLGYRDLYATNGPFMGHFKAHEFHYATTLKAEGTPLFAAKDASGSPLPDMGITRDNVSGSFAHLIAPAVELV